MSGASARLEDLSACFQGIIPAIIATCSADGEPNVTYLSQVYYVDSRHVALSCQFFNKTRRNVDENPYATVLVHHPVDFELWRLRLRFQHCETEGELFERMSMRIQVIASHTGMSGVFRLLSSDVYEVLSVERMEGFLAPAESELDLAPPVSSGPLTELRGVQLVSGRIARAPDLDSLLRGALEALDETLGFSHSMILVPEDRGDRLVTIATRGYGTVGTTAEAMGRADADTRESDVLGADTHSRGGTGAEVTLGGGIGAEVTVGGGIGAEVQVGDGTIGTAAEHRHMIKVTGMGSELRYGRAIRDRIEECGDAEGLSAEIPLPGLPDAQAQLALPLLARDRLVGVIAVESEDPLAFDEWDEAFLQILANQIALGIDRMQDEEEQDSGDGEDAGTKAETEVETKSQSTSTPTAATPVTAPDRSLETHHAFVYYPNDDCVFVDGEYLIRNVPGKILWKLLREFDESGRTEFTNRELRLDESLGLPPVKDNLEARLILLRKRLVARCPGVRLVPVRRGRFALEIDGAITLEEKECGA